MNKKILLGLIIMGVIFIGSATYALFNENILLNGFTSDIQTNNTPTSNNQLNIHNNQSNIILNSENFNLSHHNNIANVVLKGIGDDNDDVGQKIVKEVSRFTTNNKTLVLFDDSSYSFTMNNHTYHAKFVLTKIYDVNSVSGGYVECTNCNKFIPVGDVSGLVPEDYLCDCGAYIIGKNVPYVYSEESVLEHIKHAEDYYKHNGKPVDNPFDAHSINISNIEVNNVSDEVNKERIDFTIPPEIDYSRFDLIEIPPQEHHGMVMYDKDFPIYPR